jgi:DNA helicase-2/ATP-dependent DNA helicase PcrA
MTDTVTVATDDNQDMQADEQILTTLNLENPASFFLFADAGSGKTRSLSNALRSLCGPVSECLRLYGHRVGVITYTNAACDEIKSRVEFDPLIEVSTIHSFVWLLISGFQADIRSWLKQKLANDIAELQEEQKKGRAGTKAATAREHSIQSKQKRLNGLDKVQKFTYNPTGDNRGRDSLNHSEVIDMGAYFLTNKPLMQRILVSKFPILLIDECQDTNKQLMDALLKVQHSFKGTFCLGLFGDVMQRIYLDGKEDLGTSLPADWVAPVKRLNHRCPRRVIRLINKIRSSVDGHVQVARSDSQEGFVHMFVISNDTVDKAACERKVKEQMAKLTTDPSWSGSDADVKTLTLEHHMAAQRMGFLNLFQALDPNDGLKTGLRDGSLPGVRFFSQLVHPMRMGVLRGDKFAVAALVRKASPLLSKSALQTTGIDQQGNVTKTREAVDKLMSIWQRDKNPRFLDILNSIAITGLFEIPESLQPFIGQESTVEDPKIGDKSPLGEDDVQTDPDLDSWAKFLMVPFAEIGPYEAYISGRSPFATHQGVKGLEFPRVMVVMDDTEARGFLFSYDKLFGAKEKTKTDLENEKTGKDSTIDRTRRLFYVTCSRTKGSLAILAYSSDPEKIRKYVITEGWFEQDEVQVGV